MGVGPRADGVAVMRDLFARPSQLAPLLRVSLDAYFARSAMQRLRRRLGPHFAFTDPSIAALGASELALSGLVDASGAHYRSPA
jgi:hypothetical protein